MNNLRKIVCALLMLAMLVPMMSFGTSAADFVNLYDNAQATIGVPPTTKDAPGNGNANYYVSNPVAVKEGDVVTFGPVQINQGYFLTTYDANGNKKIAQVTYADCTKVDTILPGTEIVQWKVPAGSAYIRMGTSQLYFDCSMITVNQTFKTADYFAAMDKAGVNVEFLRPAAAKGELVNVFPKSDKVYAGRVDKSNTEIAAEQYRTSPAVPVNEGDVIYLAAADFNQGYHLVLLDKNGKGTTTVKLDYMVQYDVIGNDFGVLAFRMRPGTGYVRIIVATGVYDDGIQLATINQPFTAADYMKMNNITLPGTVDSTSPLKGKKMLFMGDSISYGAGDAASPFRTGRAWAGRIADWTGAITTNASVSGAKVSFQRGDDNWVYSQYVPHQNTKFDIIVMHGGVNDARHLRPVGTLSEGTDEATLKKNQASFVGGLEWIFYNVSKTNTEAKLFFIANHRLDGHDKGHAKDMSAYFNAAKQACEKWGVHCLDLVNNTDFLAEFDVTSGVHTFDGLHPNKEGYDIITPYVVSWLEEVMCEAASVRYQQLSLGDDLSMRFDIAVSAAYAENATVSVTVNGENVVDKILYNSLSDGMPGCKKIVLDMAAAQMTDSIVITICNGDDVLAEETYSVRDYVKTLINGEYDDKTKELAFVLNTGAAVQISVKFDHCHTFGRT